MYNQSIFVYLMDFEAPCSDIEQSKEIEEKDDNIKPVVEFDKKNPWKMRI